MYYDVLGIRIQRSLSVSLQSTTQQHHQNLGFIHSGCWIFSASRCLRLLELWWASEYSEVFFMFMGFVHVGPFRSENPNLELLWQGHVQNTHQTKQLFAGNGPPWASTNLGICCDPLATQPGWLPELCHPAVCRAVGRRRGAVRGSWAHYRLEDDMSFTKGTRFSCSVFLRCGPFSIFFHGGRRWSTAKAKGCQCEWLHDCVCVTCHEISNQKLWHESGDAIFGDKNCWLKSASQALRT